MLGYNIFLATRINFCVLLNSSQQLEIIYSGYILSVKMATFGKIDEFTDSDNWTQYIERLNYYFQANDITDGTKKRNILLTVCGSKIYGLIRNLLSPAKLDTKSYDQISKLVEKHLNPKPSVVVRRFRFYNKIGID